MSSQLNFLAGVVEAARDGEEGSVKLLRQICAAAVEHAPPTDLCTIGECLVKIGKDMERADIAGN